MKSLLMLTFTVCVALVPLASAQTGTTNVTDLNGFWNNQYTPDLSRALAVNLVGPFRLTKAVAGSMVLRGAGRRAPMDDGEDGMESGEITVWLRMKVGSGPKYATVRLSLNREETNTAELRERVRVVTEKVVAEFKVLEVRRLELPELTHSLLTEFKVEQNGKLAFQAAQSGEQLAAGVKSCSTTPPKAGAKAGAPGATA